MEVLCCNLILILQVSVPQVVQHKLITFWLVSAAHNKYQLQQVY